MPASSSTVWEFRSTATASMANGGGFDSSVTSPGTDYSLQDAAQYSLSSLTSSGAGNVILTASASADMNGNAIHITAGTNFTTGWFIITSVSVGVSITCATNAAGTAVTTGVGASGVGAIGGALNFGSATLDTAFAVQPQPGNTVWIKNGSYSTGSAIAAGTVGSDTGTVKWVGYNASRGDNPTGSSRPSINLLATAWTLAAFHDMYNLIFTGTADGMVIGGAPAKFVNIKLTNTSTTAGRSGLQGSTGFLVLNCEVISYRGNAIKHAAMAQIDGCYIHDSDVGITSSSIANPYMIINNIFADNVSNGIKWTGASQSGGITISNNTFYGAENKLGVGLTFPSGTKVAAVLNNIIYGFTTGITDAEASETTNYDDYNNYFNNSTDNTNWVKGSNSKALNPQFTNVAQLTGTAATTSGSVLTDGTANFSTVTDNVDFCYIASGTGITAGKYKITSHTATTLTLDIAPGNSAVADKVYQVTTGHNFLPGANMQNTGFPGIFPAGLSTGVMTMGAVQRDPISSDPGIANVKSGVGYTVNDTSLTGTLVVTTGGGMIMNNIGGFGGIT